MKNGIKGVVLAGGLGSRLFPLTSVTNKHLLPIYNKPMVYYPIQTLVDAGIDEVLIVTGGNNAGDFLRLLGSGKQLGLKHIEYAYQKGEGGIADALNLAKDFVGDDNVAVILGDNIIEKSIKTSVNKFLKQEEGARILIKKVIDPERFGVVAFKDGRIVNISEKPRKPKTQYAVTGIRIVCHSSSPLFSTVSERFISRFEVGWLMVFALTVVLSKVIRLLPFA